MQRGDCFFEAVVTASDCFVSAAPPLVKPRSQCWHYCIIVLCVVVVHKTRLRLPLEAFLFLAADVIMRLGSLPLISFVRRSPYL